jgi:NTP pyrophosphatase (non-canonical NTP hydrolase)
MSDLDAKIQDVANHWDYNMPIMAMEELAEAIQAISKVERASDEYIRAEETDPEVANAAWYMLSKRFDELKDEIRDVYISLKALMYRYQINEEDVMDKVVEKLNRKY